LELDHVLIAVTDLAAAAREFEARYGLASIEGGRHPGWGTPTKPGGRPFGWVVRTDELDDVARRLGLAVEAGSRAAPSGQLVRWRSAGIEQAAAESLLPFFIEWGQGTPLPGRAAVTHPAGSVAITRLELAGDVDRLAVWLDNHRLPIAVRAGRPDVTNVVLTGTAGEIVVG